MDLGIHYESEVIFELSYFESAINLDSIFFQLTVWINF